MLKVGITGGIGSGKSTASNRMAELGAYIFDADKEAKKILIENEKVHQQIKDAFRTNVIDANDFINPKKLAKAAFSNEANQTALNAILHPYVFSLIDKRYDQIKNNKEISIFVVDAALIYETGLDQHLDYVIVISAQYGLRMNRALNRKFLSREDIQRRMDLQLPEDRKIQMADFIINNDHTEKELMKQVDEIYKEIT